MNFRLNCNKTVSNKYIITTTRLKYKKSKILPRIKWQHYNNKLDCSISRSKNNIINICNFNKFYYFFTLTINSCYDRKDLTSFINRINNVVKYLNKKSNSKDFYYLLVPELHKDDKNFHVHGFLSERFKEYFYINKNGYPALSCFKKLGFDSISVIKNYDACIHYCLKYICKDLISNNLSKHLYFCSQGLKRSNIIKSGSIAEIPPLHFDFKSMYVYKTTINENKYYNFITKIDNDPLIHYYDYS